MLSIGGIEKLPGRIMCLQSSARKDIISSRFWCSYAARIARVVSWFLERVFGEDIMDYGGLEV